MNEQPTNAPTAKVTAAGAAGALSILVIFILGELDIHITPEAAAAAATLLAFVGGYFKRETGPVGGDRGLTTVELLAALTLAGVIILIVLAV